MSVIRLEKGVTVSFVSEWASNPKDGKGISVTSFFMLKIHHKMENNIDQPYKDDAPLRKRKRLIINEDAIEEEIPEEERQRRDKWGKEVMKKYEDGKAQRRRERRGVIFFIVLKMIVSATLILAAAIKFHYDYYSFLRWFVCGSSTLYIYIYYKNQKPPTPLMACFFIAILFNPIIPVYLSRSSWQPIDYSLAAVIIISVLFDVKYYSTIPIKISKA